MRVNRLYYNHSYSFNHINHSSNNSSEKNIPSYLPFKIVYATYLSVSNPHSFPFSVAATPCVIHFGAGAPFR